VSEASLNGFPSSKIAATFREDPFRFLACADKNQTGYDFLNFPDPEADNALQRAVLGIMNDDTQLLKQFADNPDFKRWLGETVFGLAYEQAGRAAGSRALQGCPTATARWLMESWTMSIKAEYSDRVFVPLEEVEEPAPGEVYQVFSESELRRLAADVPWMERSERSFEFWENEEDAVHDGPESRDGIR